MRALTSNEAMASEDKIPVVTKLTLTIYEDQAKPGQLTNALLDLMSSSPFKSMYPALRAKVLKDVAEYIEYES